MAAPRRDKAGIAQAVVLATEATIALAQIEGSMAQAAPGHGVPAAAGLGAETALREHLGAPGLGCVVVWGAM
ncbi:MAG: hypothetical protein WA094_12915 [Candidatus Desulfobacillus denitrificans]